MYSLENLAKLFRPKNALLGKVLEISIDDLCFVSYPCQCHGLEYDDAQFDSDVATNGFASSPSPVSSMAQTATAATSTTTTTANSATTAASSSSSTGSGRDTITMFNVIITSVSSTAMKKINPNFEFKCQHKSASVPGIDPVAAALGLRAQSYGICKQTIRRKKYRTFDPGGFVYLNIWLYIYLVK